MNLESGTTISHYKILSEIGKGGMGEVYLAQDTKLNRNVAIKFLTEEWSKDSDKLNRFIQEAQAASALNHPNIITIHEIGETDNTQYIALEYIEGETLTGRLHKKLKFNEALDIATQIASALDAAHTAGIVHRDIKPDNVMIRKDGLVKILDFGIAKLTEKRHGEGETRRSGEEDKTLIAASPSPSVPESPNTTPGMIIGTANYMSPEQAKGESVDARTDIFSFGVLLFEMLAGHLPFEGKTPMEIIGAVIHKEPKPMDEEFPDELQRIISKTLRKDRDERYQTIKDLLIDLKDVKAELEFQDKLEQTVSPQKEEPKTQMFKATTVDEQKQTTTANDSITIKKSGLSKALIGIFAILVISATGFGYWYFSGGKQINSIAVMPFINESGNEDIEYLSDGMTETLIASLTEIPNLSVKARSTVFYYKGKNKSPKEIGDELDVEAVLLGRLVQRGDDIKLSLELVDTSTLDAIWSQTYDRKMNNLITLQSEIARNVSDKLRLKLTASEEEKVARSGTASPEAQQLYLKGLFHFNERITRDGTQEMKKGVRFFKQAIEKDPNYALPYAGLAASYSIIALRYGNDPGEYLSKGKEAAQKALELDPNLAEAHAALGRVLLYTYDWQGAERSFLKAIEVNPKYAKGHQWYADYLASKGMFDEALKNFDKALELDPFDQVANFMKVGILIRMEKYDEALSQAKKYIELFPDNPRGPGLLSTIYLRKGMEPNAIEQRWMAMEKRGIPNARIEEAKDVYEKAGLDGLKRYDLEREWRGINNALEADKNAFIMYRGVYRAYANLKDKEKTLEYLNKAYQQREPGLVSLKREPFIDFLRDEPEFQELLKKVGFPDSES
ncbi:MAG: protein kinase [Pyrinomonadaceae bacterium]|nr:protein kinase [Pyrinomonadaceae bacterium]